MTPAPRAIDLEDAAHAAMVEHDFDPGFSPEIEREVAALPDPPPRSEEGARIRDMRSLPWSSIDNPDSRDLDQVEVADERGDGAILVRVGVADVDLLVERGSATDRRAGHNTTSVYTGVKVFPMLPERLSTHLTSLNEGEDRLAIVIEMMIGSEGEVLGEDVYRALVHNHAKLSYESVGDWLEEIGPEPEPFARMPELATQIRLQHEAASRLRFERARRGALTLETIEARPVVADGAVIDIAVTSDTPARDIIENFMVAANGAMARYLESRGMPSLRRVVRTPKRWDRIRRVAEDLGTTLPAAPDRVALAEFLVARRRADPEHFPDLSLTIVKLLGNGEYILERRTDGTRAGDGHFGLAAAEYTHSTAPNRRFPDLVTQRLVKFVLDGGSPPYEEDELMDIAARCTEMEDEAKKVERIIRKKAAAVLMLDRIGEEFTAIVTGASPKGIYVRLLAPAVEGRVMRGGDELDVGDTVRVRLARSDPERGHIDFEVPAGDLRRKLERSHRKRAMADRLRPRIGEAFRARVTGVNDRGIWVRTLDGSAEGKVVRGGDRLAVGDEVTVTLVDADTVHGFIDFEYEPGVAPRKQERRRRKQAAAVRLRGRIGERFRAEVTGVPRRAVWVRTLGSEVIEGRLVRGWKDAGVGDRIPVVLLRVDPKRGWIDFARDA